ncbi:hypothetical protein SALWKB2_1058 [Snodgrassella alvi wkB2]|uniref:Lipoprotein n=1 Tax=Snodgrassella alvi TaxID=1196083 RepID=A0ABD7Z098_9NEIS|nr:hypothetical protein [Snodgrassella alvi]AHN28440.1 hypothetical protein SALWKB2_1058 [Snodgrassella alvi wkB2]PIT46745.1 hypothetical protein BHC45_02760 [Snodgrassella alvi]PIT66490.1 hypothetical protein BHC52_01195 [Snodgrassella alvi]UOO98454.1 hypothetical protein LVJ87_10635 [Snodgrassella alvi wkB2]WLS97585.1 hypothetical protein RAM05_06845 [Snodgrassella alvi]
MKKISVLAVSLLLAACGGKQEASNHNFTEAIDDFAKNDKVCLVVNLMLDNAQGGMNNTVALGNKEIRIARKNSDGDKVNKTALKQMDILTDADLYEKGKDATLVVNGGKDIPQAVYYRTSKGEDNVQNTAQGSMLCLGTQKVDKIVLFTEPTPANGMTISKVVYDAKLVPEKWAEKLLKTTDENWWKSMQEPQRRAAVLVLTDKGWKDERALR